MQNNQRGLSLVETMVAVAILGGAIIAAATYISRVSETRVNRATQMMFRFIAIQTVQSVVLDPGLFPPISSGDVVNYVACLGKNGTLVNNVNSIRGFVYHRGAVTPRTPSGLCDQGANYESRLTWITPAAGEEYRQVEITVVNLKRKSQDNLSARNFKIAIE